MMYFIFQLHEFGLQLGTSLFFSFLTICIIQPSALLLLVIILLHDRNGVDVSRVVLKSIKTQNNTHSNQEVPVNTTKQREPK